AATDPEEGGALGVAVVDHFRAVGAFTLVSTHLLALKVYGANTSGVLNASMGFDEQTLEPTYRLRTGAPGKSAGLDIATRLGMPAHVMDRARQSMSTRERDLASFLSELHRRLEATADLERTLRAKIDEGARVRLKGVSDPARVRRKLGADLIEVEAGFLKMQVSIDDVLEVLPAAGESRKLPKNVSFQPAPQLRPAFQEINVIGEHAE